MLSTIRCGLAESVSVEGSSEVLGAYVLIHLGFRVEGSGF